jgi:hypothetical protein
MLLLSHIKRGEIRAGCKRCAHKEHKSCKYDLSSDIDELAILAKSKSIKDCLCKIDGSRIISAGTWFAKGCEAICVRTCHKKAIKLYTRKHEADFAHAKQCIAYTNEIGPKVFSFVLPCVLDLRLLKWLKLSGHVFEGPFFYGYQSEYVELIEKVPEDDPRWIALKHKSKAVFKHVDFHHENIGKKGNNFVLLDFGMASIA